MIFRPRGFPFGQRSITDKFHIFFIKNQYTTKRGRSPVEHGDFRFSYLKKLMRCYRGLTEGIQEPKLRFKKADLRPENADWKLERADLKLERAGLRLERSED